MSELGLPFTKKDKLAYTIHSLASGVHVTRMTQSVTRTLCVPLKHPRPITILSPLQQLRLVNQSCKLGSWEITNKLLMYEQKVYTLHTGPP